jgi:NAD(P)-dependent dehydrogenase (short-subunit alcohol dehydrogenase family)
MTASGRSYVVTGGGRGVGRAIAERLLADGGGVVVIEAEPHAADWVEDHPAGSRVRRVVGDAASEEIAAQGADLAESLGRLAGWVNNCAVFRDAWLHEVPAAEVADVIQLNLGPALVGCATAVRRFLAAGGDGAIVNVSSHQAQRAVRGALPYATAKAAIEGLTRALAADYGPHGIRVNAVALGSIRTERYTAFLDSQEPAAAARIVDEMGRLHPLGRVGLPEEVAAAVAYLLSDDASFVNGATLPVDGGRSVFGRDPEGA